MATQKEVAERAGVSFITVSRVINQLGNVRAETKQRVEDAIRELHYHPNRQAQALNNGLTRTLALVTPRMFDRPLFDNFYVTRLLSGVEMKGRELGWDILMTTDHDQEGEFDFLRVWHQRKVDGLIFVGLKRFPSAQMEEIEAEGIPCVSISDRMASPAVSWVDSNNVTGGQQAVEKLAALGHRHLAYLGIDTTRDYSPNFRDRELGVREAATRLGLKLDFVAASSIDAAGTETPRTYLAQSPRATAVIAENDSLAFEFQAELARAGVFCPCDYSLIGFDAEPAGRIQKPTLASFGQPLLEMGQAAVQHLVDQLTGARSEKIEQVFDLEFVDGTSLSIPGGS
ncbi:MAG: LacI family DNA-binding transcriptional regulator [Spirochaetales bacterium]